MKNNKCDITFYYEWLPIEKKDFRLLAMLADLGEFSGTLSDICRYLGISTESKNIEKIRGSLLELAEFGLISASCRGRKWELTAIPQATEIQTDRNIYEKLLAHEYSSKSVSWVAILKVLIWLSNSNGELHTDAEIADAINYSTDAVSYAKAVLEGEFHFIYRDVKKWFNGKEWRRIGQRIDVSAWLNDENR